jgi:N-hydroxyarylamine O-acetyltransferase
MQHDQIQAGASYRIVSTEDFYTLMACNQGGEWEAQYKFRPEPYTYPDYAERCHFQQYSPESHFRKGRVCSRTTPDGRMTVSEVGLTRSWLDGRREEQKLENDEAFLLALEEQFGIHLPEAKWQAL